LNFLDAGLGDRERSDLLAGGHQNLFFPIRHDRAVSVKGGKRGQAR
jgi:hypothetical protein